MGTPLSDALEKLRDYNNIMSYSSAMEFCYVNAPLFVMLPSYNLHFSPFNSIHNNTYYYIGDYHQYSLEMLADDERKKALAIIYIIIVGLTQAEVDMVLSSKGIKQLSDIGQPYEFNVYPFGEFNDLGPRFREAYGYVYPLELDKLTGLYNLDLDPDSKVIVFTERLSR